MNKLLLSKRQSDSTAEEFTEAWENASYTLEPLYKTLLVLMEEANRVGRDDFDCPNHYAKLAYEAGMRTAYEQIIRMLPDSAKS